ncbi:MAG TPA: DUF5666 domain-containing protein [Terriglobia bacterium]|nr:DUF5666 domain-containing protein [Terriglobia bacterium]
MQNLGWRGNGAHFAAARWHLSQIRIKIGFVDGIFKTAKLTQPAVFVMAMLLGLGYLAIPICSLSFQRENPPPQDIAFSVSGAITEQSPGKLTVDGGQNMLFTVTYDSATTIEHEDGKAASPSDLRVGITILAKGSLTEAGDVIAKSITIQPGTKAPPK